MHSPSLKMNQRFILSGWLCRPNSLIISKRQSIGGCATGKQFLLKFLREFPGARRVASNFQFEPTRSAKRNRFAKGKSTSNCKEPIFALAGQALLRKNRPRAKVDLPAASQSHAQRGMPTAQIRDLRRGTASHPCGLELEGLRAPPNHPGLMRLCNNPFWIFCAL